MFNKVLRLKIALLKLFLDLKPVLFKKQVFTAHVENLNFQLTLQLQTVIYLESLVF